ncbi:hypothetical protein PENTCL1PPCAC_26179, partial [Pristionchus entomophagus]
LDRMPSSHKKGRADKHVKREEEEKEEGTDSMDSKPDQPSHFSKALAELKDLRRKYESANAEKSLRESKVYKLETSFLNDLKAYQEAAVVAGLIKQEEVKPLGRLFSETSTSWMKSLEKMANPENGDVDFGDKNTEERMEGNAHSHKISSDKNRKRKLSMNT